MLERGMFANLPDKREAHDLSVLTNSLFELKRLAESGANTEAAQAQVWKDIQLAIENKIDRERGADEKRSAK